MRFEVYREEGFWYWRAFLSNGERALAVGLDGHDNPGDAIRELSLLAMASTSPITRVRLFNHGGYVEVSLANATSLHVPGVDGEPTVDLEPAKTD